MTGTVSSAGVRGLEVNPLLPIATTKLTDKLTRGAHATLR
jgi:hypothetical protein